MIKASDIETSKLNISTTLMNQLITTACGIVVPRIMIGKFGSEAYGISVSIAQFLSYITLLESGIGGVARASLYEPLAIKDSDRISAVYQAIKSFFRYVAIAFLAYCIVLGIVYHDMAQVSIFSRGYIFALVLTIGLSTLAKYMGGLANLTLIVADQKQYVNNLILIVTTIVNTVSIILLTYLNCGLLWVKLGSSLIFVVRPLLYSLYVKKHYYLPKTVKQKAALEQKWTGFGQHIAYFLHSNTDIVLLTLCADMQLVAVYSVYYLVINSIRAITESFTGGMEALFGEMIAKKQTKQLQQHFYRYELLLTVAIIVLFGCTGILIVPFVQIYTHGITDADYVQPVFALILLFAEAMNCLMLPYTSLPISANRLKETRWGAYGEALINIGVSCVLIQWNPLVGVALGTLTATLFRGFFYIIYSSRNILNIPVHKLLLRFVGVLAILCGVIYVGSKIVLHFHLKTYFQWGVCGAVTFAVISLGVFVVIHLFKKTEEAWWRERKY